MHVRSFVPSGVSTSVCAYERVYVCTAIKVLRFVRIFQITHDMLLVKSARRCYDANASGRIVPD